MNRAWTIPYMYDKVPFNKQRHKDGTGGCGLMSLYIFWIASH